MQSHDGLKKDAGTQSITADDRQNQVNLHMSTPTTAGTSKERVNISAVKASRPRVCFKVVPVKVSNPTSEKELVTYAFLDSGSDTKELSVINAKPAKYTMTTVNFATTEGRL